MSIRSLVNTGVVDSKRGGDGRADWRQLGYQVNRPFWPRQVTRQGGKNQKHDAP